MGSVVDELVVVIATADGVLLNLVYSFSSLSLSPSLSVSLCLCLSVSLLRRTRSLFCSSWCKPVVDFLVVAPVPCFGRVVMPNEPKRNLTKAHKATPRKMHGAVMKRIQKFIIPFAVLRIVTTRKLYDPAQRNSQSIWNDPCAETPSVFFLVSEPDPHQSNKPSTHNKQHNTNPVE